MASDSGSQEPRPHEPIMYRPERESRHTMPAEVCVTCSDFDNGALVPASFCEYSSKQMELTAEEQDRIADGEPYCFRCGKPASSFIAGAMMAQDDEPISPAEYVRREEGTYNPDTNRFACDACYIAIGMPTAPEGWKAP